MANVLRKIDSIMFRVKDLDESTKLYQRTFGLKKVWEDKKRKMIGFVFPESDSEIVIHQDPNIPNPDFSFLVDNVEEFCLEYKSRGYEIAVEPFDMRTGKYAVLKDLDGNLINIIDLTKFGGTPKYD